MSISQGRGHRDQYKVSSVWGHFVRTRTKMSDPNVWCQLGSFSHSQLSYGYLKSICIAKNLPNYGYFEAVIRAAEGPCRSPFLQTVNTARSSCSLMHWHSSQLLVNNYFLWSDMMSEQKLKWSAIWWKWTDFGRCPTVILIPVTPMVLVAILLKSSSTVAAY